MNDIVERLRSSVMWYSANAETVMEAAAEIERLRARLEIDPSHPYDGIYARDETIRQQDKQIERLRAVLEDIAYPNPLHNEDNLMGIARAALEGRA